VFARVRFSSLVNYREISDVVLGDPTLYENNRGQLVSPVNIKFQASSRQTSVNNVNVYALISKNVMRLLRYIKDGRRIYQVPRLTSLSERITEFMEKREVNHKARKVIMHSLLGVIVGVVRGSFNIERRLLNSESSQPLGFEKSIDIKLCLWRRVEVSCFSTTTADAINAAKPYDTYFRASLSLC